MLGRLFLLVVTTVATLLVIAISQAVVTATRVGVNCRKLSNPVMMAAKQCICEPCHVCEYALTNFRCQEIVSSDTDISDGSKIKPQQQALDPATWFLTKAEITAARNGVPRDDLNVYTDGNEVSTYNAGDQFFSAVQNAIKAAGANDSIYLTAWSVANVPFDPVNDKAGKTSSFKALFGGAMTRGVDFRALVWQNDAKLDQRSQILDIRDYINSQPTLTKSSAKGRMIIDDRLPYPYGSSHHQKTVLVRQKKELVVFVGGIDLTSDRWDTVNHNQAALRKEAKIYHSYDGWLDAHMRIRGPATLDVGANFLARWNSKTKTTQGPIDAALNYKNIDESSPLPPLTANGSLVIPQKGSASVQITRTFSCKYKGYEFAPKGERSILNSRLKAISLAKNFIFIEDQYFIEVPELRAALLKVLPHLQRLIVVVQRPTADTSLVGYMRFLYDMIAPIQTKFPNKFQLYTTKKSRNLYIHSKFILVDDVFLSIGSANWNRRSMTSDSELVASVIDHDHVTSTDGVTVAKIAKDFRVRKFAEYTGKSYAEIDRMTFLDAANALDAAANDPKSILETYEVSEALAIAEVAQPISDPDDTC